MILDSFYENRAPVQRMRGVSRLNNRLSFYAYEGRKLRYFQSRALPLRRENIGTTSASSVYAQCWRLETVVVEYVFTPQSV